MKKQKYNNSAKTKIINLLAFQTTLLKNKIKEFKVNNFKTHNWETYKIIKIETVFIHHKLLMKDKKVCSLHSQPKEEIKTLIRINWNRQYKINFLIKDWISKKLEKSKTIKW